MYNIYPRENPYEQLMDDDHTLKAYFHRKGSGDAEGPDTCPKLYTWNGTGYMAVTCPYCGKDIFIPKYKPVPITEEEFRKRAQNEMTAKKQNRNV